MSNKRSGVKRALFPFEIELRRTIKWHEWGKNEVEEQMPHICAALAETYFPPAPGWSTVETAVVCATFSTLVSAGKERVKSCLPWLPHGGGVNGFFQTHISFLTSRDSLVT